MKNELTREDLRNIEEMKVEAVKRGIEWGKCWCGCGQNTKITKVTNRKTYRFKGISIKYIKFHHSNGKSPLEQEEELKYILEEYNKERVICGVVYGECFCGCGKKTEVPIATGRRCRRYVGIPLRYVCGHFINGKSSNEQKIEYKQSLKEYKEEAVRRNIIFGYCFCGCGDKTKVGKYTTRHQGWIKGVPRRFITGHNTNKQHNPNWKHGQYDQGKNPYKYIYAPNHPKAMKNGYILEHIVIAEKALGKFLPDGCEVHHVDCNPKNNAPSNLVICENREYHMFLHKRMRDLRKANE